MLTLSRAKIPPPICAVLSAIVSLTKLTIPSLLIAPPLSSASFPEMVDCWTAMPLYARMPPPCRPAWFPEMVLSMMNAVLWSEMPPPLPGARLSVTTTVSIRSESASE